MASLVSSPSAPPILGSPSLLAGQRPSSGSGLARPPSYGALMSAGGGGLAGRPPRRGKAEAAEAYVRALRERGIADVDALAPAVREHFRLLPSR